MPYAEGARFDPDKGCLPGTRTGIVDEICHWVQSSGDNVARMFLLSGVAGSGKSSIAHTVALLFDKLGRLGSSFCFDRFHLADRRPDNVFSTIARDLADLDLGRKHALWQLIRDNQALRRTRAPREQFEKFILEPAADLVSVGPVVIVIDALDECGDPASRKVLLSILAEGVAHLPSNFRVLVTTRAEQDIEDALTKKPLVMCKRMEAIDMRSSQHDISLYVREQLANVPQLVCEWPNHGWCKLLVDKSRRVVSMGIHSMSIHQWMWKGWS